MYKNSFRHLPSSSDDCKQFMRTFLTPRPEFQKYIEDTLCVGTPYTIMHMRLGDSYLLYNNTHGFMETYNILSNNITANAILISDSKDFKDFVAERNKDVVVFSTIPGHIGLSTDDAVVRDTLVEFMIASRSSSIKTHSNYGWVSGFMTAVHKIYDVPITSF